MASAVEPVQFSSDGSLQAVAFCRSPRRQGLVHPDEQDWRTHCSRWEEDPNLFLQRSLLRADRVPPFHPAPKSVIDEEAPADFEPPEAEPGDEIPSELRINAPVRPTRKELEEHVAFLYVPGVRPVLGERPRQIHTREWTTQTKPHQL